MIEYPETIDNETQLEELLSRPTDKVVEMFKAIEGDLLDTTFVKRLPLAANVFFLAGMKFGSATNLALTWAMNTYVPALVAEQYRDSKIVAFSTGCVYPLVAIGSGGSREEDQPEAIGEYAQSCLGRERMFEHGSLRYNTPVTLLRLNYSVEMRYGVLVDLATKVNNGESIDLSMGYLNVIWQGDMNAATLLSLNCCDSPPQQCQPSAHPIRPAERDARTDDELDRRLDQPRQSIIEQADALRSARWKVLS